jgi:Tripartite tricarboxylate transporter family receptor
MASPSRRDLLHAAPGAVALALPTRSASAQSYPTRPVRLVVPFPAGGATDLLARLIGQWLSERDGQPFIIDNRPGAGGNIGTESVVRAPPDGYTLLAFDTTSAVNATLYDRLNFNFIRDIAPVASIVRLPFVVLLHPSVPAKTIPELIAYAKANPGKINMASAGNGTLPHVAGELFKMLTATEMRGCAGARRPSRRPSAGLFRHDACLDRARQDRQAARHCGDDGSAARPPARSPDSERHRPRLRSDGLVGRGRSEGHAGGSR